MKNLYLLFFTLLCTAGFAQNKYIDSVKTLTSSKIDTIRFWAYSELIWELKDKDKKSALEYGTALLSESKKSDNQKWIAQGYNDLGIVYYRGGNLKLALENFEPSLVIRKKLGNKKDIASSLSKIAIVKAENKEYNKALELQLEVLKIYEDLNILPYIAQTCNNIGQLCNYTKNFLMVRQYLSRAYAIGEKLHNANTMSLTMFALATNYYNLKKIDSAIICYDIAKGKFKIAGNLAGYATSCSNLGQMYKEQGKNKEALLAYKEAIEVSKSINDSSSVASFESHYAEFLISENRLAEAEKILLNALAIAKKLGHGNIEVNNYQQLTSLYIQMKNPEQADFYFKKYQAVKDSIFSNENAKQFSEMEIKYETEKKDRQISDLNKDNQLKTATIERNALLIIGLLLVLALSAVIFYLWRRKQLHQQEVILQEQKMRLREAQISAVIDSQEKERIRFATDLHDGIGQMVSALQLTVQSLKQNQNGIDTRDKLFDNSEQLLTEIHSEIRNIAFNLMPPVLVKEGLVPAVSELIRKINKAGKIKGVLSHFEFEGRFAEIAEISLYRIIQEFMSNIIKYSLATRVNISFTGYESEAVLTIDDDGIGYDLEKFKNSEGNGWRNINSRLNLIKSTIEFDVVPNRKNNTITITVPAASLQGNSADVPVAQNTNR